MNKVEFQSYSQADTGLSKTNVVDLIDSLYRGDSRFIFYGVMRSDRRSKPTLGLHVYSEMCPNVHEIYIAPDKIRNAFSTNRPTGGNKVAYDARVAVGMVIAHEVQHANQTHLHVGSHKNFYGKERSRYRTRPCEMEARQFADDNIGVISGILGFEIPKTFVPTQPNFDELELVAECLAESDIITVPDIVSELKLSGMNNAVNVMNVKRILESDWGVVVGTRS